MKIKWRIVLTFGLTQLLLSIVLWGNFEHSLLSGDSLQGSEISFWAFVLGDRLAAYLAFSLSNSVLFGVASIGLSSIFHPSFVGAVIVAIGTVVITVLLLLNSAFRVPYPLASPVAFLLTSLVYGLISKLLDRRGGAKTNIS